MKIKFVILTILVSFISPSIKSQSTWELDRCVWVDVQILGSGSYISQIYHAGFHNCDTTINSIFYKKITNDTSQFSDYLFSVRSDNHKVYIVPYDSINELLMYDFSADIGDTIHNITGFTIPEIMETTYIEEKDSFLLNNKYYFVLRVRDTSISSFSYFWIENMGSTKGFIPSSSIYVEPNTLACYSFKDTTVDIGSIFSCCPLLGLTVLTTYGDSCYGYSLTNIDETTSQQSLISITPNPNQGIFTVTLETNTQQTETQLTVFNVMGQEILNQVQNDNTTTIDITTQPPGIYYIKVTNQTGLLKVQKIILSD